MRLHGPAPICGKVRECEPTWASRSTATPIGCWSGTGAGQVVDGDQLMAVIAESWKADGRLARPGVVATVMSNLGFERYLGELGITLERTAVGDRYVLEHMREHGYNVGGEALRQHHLVGLRHHRRRASGCVAGAGGGEEARQAGLAGLPPFRTAPADSFSNVRYKKRQASGRRHGGAARSRPPSSALTVRGGWWIRPSGTEPVIRVMGEGDDKTLVEDVVGWHCRRPDRRGSLTDGHCKKPAKQGVFAV